MSRKPSPRRTTIIIAALATASLLVTALPVQAEEPPSSPTESRWAGADRFETSAEISRNAFPGTVNAAYLANGFGFPDALAGGPAAAADGAPILLVRADGIPSTVAAELKRLQPKTIYLLGGTGVIGTVVERAARAYADTVKRLAGDDRYLTATAVSKAGWSHADAVVVTSGATFADALSGGAAAAELGAPLLLTPPNRLHEATAQELTRLGPDLVYLLGGTGALSSTVEDRIRVAAPEATVVRLAGADRFATSAAVIEAVWPDGADTMMLTTGLQFADALSGTPAAHVSEAPIALVRPNCTPAAIGELLDHSGLASTVVLGGTGAVADFSSDLECSVIDARSISNPRSLWLVVNKLRPLNPRTYVPPDLVNAPVHHVNSPLLRSEVSRQLAKMFAAASAEGAGTLRLQSAYRSYYSQANGYANYVRTRGKAWADLQSARPGHSEHQTGMAVDISAGSSCILLECFASTKQGKWLASNSYRFGFVLRYPKGMTHVTGYAFEPWHFRYVGVELAGIMHQYGVKTLEAMFGLPPAPGYTY